MLGKRILVIDDDQYLLQSLVRLLGSEGFTVFSAPNTALGYELLVGESPDLMVLDLHLPGEDGVTFCRRIRPAHRLPIVMLTSKSEVVDRIVGLEVGADDYIAKPFDGKELVARIRSILRRVGEYRDEAVVADDVFELGGLRLVPSQLRVEVHGEAVEVTLLEFRLLEYFLKNSGRVLSRDQIFDQVWGYDQSFSQNSLEVLVYRLRGKVEKPLGMRLIHTIRGYGYKMELL